ncbi:MAG TPA: alpha/beta hydrolase [Pyrinomonadaceae bacterium]|jgi:pimeloyl-ACP methyl ester carboxylesterase|nr:alpha/beta hydrolase [Pyrinomonadaceae bacterium]
MAGYRFLYLGLGSVVALVSALALAGAIYQAAASRLDRERYPPPGRLVAAGGYRLHVLCSGPEGGGGPTVVMDAGIGECSLGWGLVQPEVAGFARACAYDRAGLGWSDVAPTPRTSGQMVADLHALLVNSGVRPPYVLVGHSFGGLNVRLYAARFPEEVAGMVLVDSAHEEREPRLPLYMRLGLLTAPLGIPRVFAQDVVTENPIFDRRSKYHPAYRAVAVGTAYLETARREWAAVDESWAQARGSEKSLGDMPLVVLFAKFDDEVFPRLLKLQTELAGRSTAGRLVVVEGSGHHIQHDRPEVVIDAVREVVEAVRRKSRLPAEVRKP